MPLVVFYCLTDSLNLLDSVIQILEGITTTLTPPIRAKGKNDVIVYEYETDTDVESDEASDSDASDKEWSNKESSDEESESE